MISCKYCTVRSRDPHLAFRDEGTSKNVYSASADLDWTDAVLLIMFGVCSFFLPQGTLTGASCPSARALINLWRFCTGSLHDYSFRIPDSWFPWRRSTFALQRACCRLCWHKADFPLWSWTLAHTLSSLSFVYSIFVSHSLHPPLWQHYNNEKGYLLSLYWQLSLPDWGWNSISGILLQGN